MKKAQKIVMKQKLAFPVGLSIFFLVASAIMMWIVVFGFQSIALKVIYAAASIFLIISPLLMPIGRIELDEKGIQMTVTRMLGSWERIPRRFEYGEIDRVECTRYPFFFTAKETGVIVHSARQRIVVCAIFSMEDRKRMASLLRDLSKEYGFEFTDDVGLSKS